MGARRSLRVAAAAAGAVSRPTEPAAKAAFLASNPETMDACLSLLKNAATTKSVQPEVRPWHLHTPALAVLAPAWQHPANGGRDPVWILQSYE